MLHCLATLKYPIPFFCCTLSSPFPLLPLSMPPQHLAADIGQSVCVCVCVGSVAAALLPRLSAVVVFSPACMHEIAIVSIIPIRRAFKNEQTIVDKHAANRAHDATSSFKVVTQIFLPPPPGGRSSVVPSLCPAPLARSSRPQHHAYTPHTF